MERIIDALTYLGINKEWLLTGKGTKQINITSVNNGITGIQGNGHNIVNKINSKIDALENDINSLDVRLKKIEPILKFPSWVYWIWLVGIVSLALSLIAIFCGVVPYTNWNVEIVSISIVLGFVGILATFIVVSNYMQVKEIEKKFDGKTEKLDTMIMELKKEISTNSETKAELYSEIYMTKGLIYENIDIENSILHYLLAILFSLKIPDRLQAHLILDNIFRLNRDRGISKLLNSELIKSNIKEVQTHENYDIIRNSFEELLNKITNKNSQL